MPSLADLPSAEFVKLLLGGDSGSGKTSSLVSLVKAGYKLRISDYDNLLIPLLNRVKAECPDKLGNVSFMTFRDKLRATAAGAVVDGTPKAYNDGLKAMEKWEDGTEPYKWGADTIHVTDSLTRFSDAAMRWGDFMTPTGKGKDGRPGEKDGRAIYGEAQRAVENYLSLISGELFRTNVIVIVHWHYQIQADGTTKGLPKGPGQALSALIPTYFPAMLQVERVGTGTDRVIRPIPNGMIDLKSPIVNVPAVFPAKTGLADYFKLAKGAEK